MFPISGHIENVLVRSHLTEDVVYQENDVREVDLAVRIALGDHDPRRSKNHREARDHALGEGAQHQGTKDLVPKNVNLGRESAKNVGRNLGTEDLGHEIGDLDPERGNAQEVEIVTVGEIERVTSEDDRVPGSVTGLDRDSAHGTGIGTVTEIGIEIESESTFQELCYVILATPFLLLEFISEKDFL